MALRLKTPLAGKKYSKPAATNTLRVKSNSSQQTRRLGYLLGKKLWPGAIVALTGELGSGKTTFSQGLLKGLGVRDKYLISPSFILIKEYMGRIPAYHLDLFRVKSIKELNNLGLEEYFFGLGVMIIEWAEKIKPLLPKEFLEIKFKFTSTPGDPGEREIIFSPCGFKYSQLWVAEIYQNLSRF